jgi:hypothetical protein
MELMHEIVELKRIDLATIPPIELRAKVAQRLAHVAIVSGPRPSRAKVNHPPDLT